MLMILHVTETQPRPDGADLQIHIRSSPGVPVVRWTACLRGLDLIVGSMARDAGGDGRVHHTKIIPPLEFRDGLGRRHDASRERSVERCWCRAQCWVSYIMGAMV